ncbi:MAG: Na/Pi cotransporter family protein, partial [Myxococcales bacterium]
ASSGVLTLAQSMAVLLGADVGTTITVQLISFRLSDWAPLVVFLGFAVRLATRRRRGRYLGDTVLGFGLLFFGLRMMAQGASPLVEQAAFLSAVDYFAHNPVLGVLAAALLTVLLQGSAPTIGLLISLAVAAGPESQPLSLAAVLPMVLGANLGTTVTPALSSYGQAPEGKRVAMAHVFFKVTGVLLFLPLLPWFEHLVARSGGGMARQIANAHTLFNLILALLFLPFTGLVARAITRFYQPPARELFGPKYLDARAIETPPLAFGLATREFLRLCDIVGEMLRDSIHVFERNDLDLIEDIEARDDKVDILNREIRFYLAGLGQENMTAEQADRQLTLITLTADMENAGDTINKNLLALARKKAAAGLQFSEEGLRDITFFHQKVVENFDLAMAAFSTGDEELARKVLRHRDNLVNIEAELKQKHIERLHLGLPEALDTSSIHLDVFSYLRRVNFLVSNLAEAVMASRQTGRPIGSPA